MSAAIEKISRIQRIVLHDRFVLSVETEQLLGWVFDSVHAVQWPVRRPQADSGVPQPVLRTLLTYCYVVGVLGSEEIEAAANYDETIRYLCANHYPDWQEVRAFRRNNLPWLIDAVRNVFKSALDSQFESGSYSSDALVRFVPRGLDLRAEASRRLARAVQCDCVAMDD